MAVLQVMLPERHQHKAGQHLLLSDRTSKIRTGKARAQPRGLYQEYQPRVSNQVSHLPVELTLVL